MFSRSLSGMWGVKLYRNRTNLKIAAETMLNRTVHNQYGYNFDQQLLTRSIWPLAQTDSVI